MLIATDLDGTLVPNASTSMPPYTAEVLKRVDDAGIPVVFVTGRPLRWMETFWPHIGKHGLAVVSNGAVTYDVHEREVVTTTGIEPALGLEIAAAISAQSRGRRSRSSAWTGSVRTRTSSSAIACQQDRGVAHSRRSGTCRPSSSSFATRPSTTTSSVIG